MNPGIVAESRPRLRPGCRFSEAPDQQHVLLIPEGLMNLAGPGRAILQLCDGRRTFAEILVELQSVYHTAPATQIERETVSFLERLRERGALEF